MKKIFLTDEAKRQATEAVGEYQAGQISKDVLARKCGKFRKPFLKGYQMVFAIVSA